MASSSPIILIAVPQLGDPNFFHGVVLLLQHDAEGAFGLVLNRPTGLSLGEFANNQSLTCHEALEALPVFQGGPVELERGWILHRDPSLSESQALLPGLFLSGGIETLRKLLLVGQSSFRFFLGYAGWGAGQLEEELKEGAWITVNADSRYALETPPDQTWDRVLRDLGVDPASLMLGRGLH
jgi:putative transcriptional regulator